MSKSDMLTSSRDPLMSVRGYRNVVGGSGLWAGRHPVAELDEADIECMHC